MKIVIAEPIADKLNDLISENNKDWIAYSDGPKDKKEFIERIKDADVATAYTMKFDDEILSQCPNLKYLAIPAVGAGSYVDMEVAEQYGVTVMNCPGYNSRAVAEMAIGLALDVFREISSMNEKMKDGFWEHNPLNGQLLSGKHIALIGYGNVGRTIHLLLKEWCSEFEIVNSISEEKDIDKSLQKSDVVFFVLSAK
jgi:lactate dehydrogenase-like 2-hydroxyacid dehydrogenase